MFNDRAGLGAKTYLLPQPPPQQPMAEQKPFDDGISMLDDLQYVENQTADWYKKAAELKSFMQSAHRNLGIDVRTPDLSRPESIELHNAYKNALADLLAHGNELKTGYKMQQLNTSMNREYAPGSDPTKVPVSRMVPGLDVASGRLDQAVTELNDKMQTPSYTKEDFEDKQRDRERLLKVYKDRLANAKDPREKFWIQKQIDGIIAPSQSGWRPWQPSTWDKNRGAKDNALDVFFKKAVNFVDGTSEQWKASTKPVPGQPGVMYLRNSEYSGMGFGDKKSPIKYAEMDPTTRQGKFYFADGSTEEFDPNDPIPILQKFVAGDRNVGFTGEDMMDYMYRKKDSQGNPIYTGTGSLNKTPFLDTPEAIASRQTQVKEESLTIAAAQAAVSDKIRGMEQDVIPTVFYNPKTWNRNKTIHVPVKIPGSSADKLVLKLSGTITDPETGKDIKTYNTVNFDEVFSARFIDKNTNKVNNATKRQIANVMDNNQPLSTILNYLITILPKQQLDLLLKDLNLGDADIQKYKQQLSAQQNHTDEVLDYPIPDQTDSGTNPASTPQPSTKTYTMGPTK